MKWLFSLVCLQNLVAYELAIISMFRNTAPYIKEWIEYHNMVGVDHFWLYNDESTDNWKEVLDPYIQSGLVEVFHWPAGKPCWVEDQIKAFQDGMRRALGVAKWIALIDQDEFILPMREKTIPKCLNKHFLNASAIYANWRNFGTGGVYLHKGEPLLAHLKACAKKNNARNWVGKSILRPECAQIENMWNPHFCLLKDGFQYVNGDGKHTLTFHETDLIPDDTRHHSRYIRINHYAFRDEKYFYETRLPRDSEPQLILKLYDDFNQEEDTKILEFIKKHYPKKYKKFWKK